MSLAESLKRQEFIDSPENPLSKRTMWDAIISWRDELIKKEGMVLKSKDSYLCSIYKIIEQNPAFIEQTLEAYLQGTGISPLTVIVNNKKNWSDKTIQLRQEQANQLHWHIINNVRYIESEEIPRDQQRNIDLKLVKHMLSTSRILTEIKELSPDDISRFFFVLKQINIRDYIISKLVWIAKIPFGVILDLKINNLIEEKNVIEIPGSCSFKFTPEVFHDMRPYLYQRFKEEANKLNLNSNSNLERILVEEPQALFKLIKEIIKDDRVFTDEGLLFKTRTGKAVNYNQILNTMETASREARLDFDMTPRILYTHAIACPRNHYERIYKYLCEDYRLEEIKKINKKDEKISNKEIAQAVKE